MSYRILKGMLIVDDEHGTEPFRNYDTEIDYGFFDRFLVNGKRPTKGACIHRIQFSSGYYGLLEERYEDGEILGHRTIP